MRGTERGDVMSIISERATRVWIVMLLVALATMAAGWTAAARICRDCCQQTHTCAPAASLTCCFST